MEAQTPPSRPYYSERGRGPLVGPALPLGRAPLPLSPACPPALCLQRKALRYLNFDFILFYFISLLPRADAVPTGTAPPAPRPAPHFIIAINVPIKARAPGRGEGGGGSRRAAM